MRKSLAQEQAELAEAVREVGRVVWDVWRPILEGIDRALVWVFTRGRA